jgi:hypothetical protein
LEVGRDALLGDQQGQPLEVVELFDALVRMREQHLRVLLEHRGDHERRDVLLDRIQRLQVVGAHVEVDAADRQQQPVVHIWPARQDRDVEAVLAEGAVDQRLVEAAVLALRHPVGGEGHLVELLSAGRRNRGHN